MEPSSPLFHINILRQYINALSVNIKPELLPKELNLIFDSGAVNGLLGIGAALYIHHLEQLNYLKINKISGCSIGSLIAVWYICGCPDKMYNHIDTLFSYYKETKNFFIFEQIVTQVIDELFTSDLEMSNRLNGILYINYYDTKKCKQRVISNFKNCAHLKQCIIRSSHIPFLTSNCHKYQGRYIDGIAPYIFPANAKCKNLFIQLIKFTAPLKSLNIKREKNIYSRLIRGVVDTNDFFLNDSTELCRYVDCQTKLHLFVRQYIVIIFFYFIDQLVNIKNNIPDYFKGLDFYKKICSMCRISWPYLLENMI
jgi:hypothetical protein